MGADLQVTFREAVVLFEEGVDDDAALLFAQCVREGDARLAADAKRYLELIGQRADALPFARATHLLRRGHDEAAVRDLKQVVEVAGRHCGEAATRLDEIASRKPARRGRPVIDMFGAPASAGVAGDAAGAAPSRALRRTPHLDVVQEPPFTAGALLDINVYVDLSAMRDGETADELVIDGDGDVFRVTVRLVATEHFRIEGPSIKPITVRRDTEKSEVARFTVRVVQAVTADGGAGLTALFEYGGRPAGKVTRKVPSTAGPQPRRTERLSIDGAAGAADLTITIVAKPINNGREFWCTVKTPLLPDYEKGVTGDWNLPERSETIVSKYMHGFTEQSERSLLVAKLKGAGRALFAASPPVFREAFWALVDNGRLPQDIAIVSEEPFIPWELMVPARSLEGVLDRREPLGVEFRIGRWTSPSVAAATRTISVADGYVIAPEYAGTRALPYAQQEASMLVNDFNATRITPATFTGIEAQFTAGGRDLIHFACHGGDEQVDQSIYLDGEKKLQSLAFAGMDAADTAFAARRPLVFLNACEVGRTLPALTGIGGFASVFIEKGASAVVAPLWSVKDTIAHEVAVGFYKQLDSKPMAEILRDFRRKAYDPAVAEDSYAAYCFYGDPEATRVTTGRIAGREA